MPGAPNARCSGAEEGRSRSSRPVWLRTEGVSRLLGGPRRSGVLSLNGEREGLLRRTRRCGWPGRGCGCARRGLCATQSYGVGGVQSFSESERVPRCCSPAGFLTSLRVAGDVVRVTARRDCGFHCSARFITAGIKRRRRRIKTRKEAEMRGSGRQARKRKAKTKRRIENGNPRAIRM